MGGNTARPAPAARLRGPQDPSGCHHRPCCCLAPRPFAAPTKSQALPLLCAHPNPLLPLPPHAPPSPCPSSTPPACPPHPALPSVPPSRPAAAHSCGNTSSCRSSRRRTFSSCGTSSSASPRTAWSRTCCGTQRSLTSFPLPRSWCVRAAAPPPFASGASVGRSEGVAAPGWWVYAVGCLAGVVCPQEGGQVVPVGGLGGAHQPLEAGRPVSAGLLAPVPRGRKRLWPAAARKRKRGR